MKVTAFILFIFCCVSKPTLFGQTPFEDNLRKKEATEIAYLIDCIKTNKTVDSLIEWKLTNTNDSTISYRFRRDRLVYFEIEKNANGLYLQEIDSYHRSFKKLIFTSDNANHYEITDQTRFGVWMSKDRLSIYFCMINPDSPMIWVLTNGNTVYSP